MFATLSITEGAMVNAGLDILGGIKFVDGGHWPMFAAEG